MAVIASCPLSGPSAIDARRRAAGSRGCSMAKILVAVAEPRILQYLVEGLGAPDREIVRAGSIEEIIDKLAEERFDVVVADIFQPVLDGVAVFSTIARAS